MNNVTKILVSSQSFLFLIALVGKTFGSMVANTKNLLSVATWDQSFFFFVYSGIKGFNFTLPSDLQLGQPDREISNIIELATSFCAFCNLFFTVVIHWLVINSSSNQIINLISKPMQKIWARLSTPLTALSIRVICCKLFSGSSAVVVLILLLFV